MTELVFIEGVSGVGKSTMVKALTGELRTLGYRARAYVEFDFTNPIDFYCTAYLTPAQYDALCEAHPDEAGVLRKHTVPAGSARLVRYYDGDTPLFSGALTEALERHEFCYHPTHLVPLADYTSAYRQVWQGFAQGLDGQEDFILFDGSLLHHPLNDMMRNYAVTAQQAAEHVHVLLHALGSTKRHVFYLKTADIGMQLAQAHRSRGQQEPAEAEISFWQTRYRNDLFVMNTLTEKPSIFDVTSNGWDGARAAIIDALCQTRRA